MSIDFLISQFQGLLFLPLNLYDYKCSYLFEKLSSLNMSFSKMFNYFDINKMDQLGLRNSKSDLRIWEQKLTKRSLDPLLEKSLFIRRFKWLENSFTKLSQVILNNKYQMTWLLIKSFHGNIKLLRFYRNTYRIKWTYRTRIGRNKHLIKRDK